MRTRLFASRCVAACVLLTAVLAVPACRTPDSGATVKEAAAATTVPVQCLAKADAVKGIQAQIDQQSSQQTSGCSAKGGALGTDGICACPGGTPVVKIGAKTCAEFTASGGTQNDTCTAAGGSVGTDDTCRCPDGTAVFKLQGQTCEQAGKSGAAQNDGCTAAGGTVASDDTCRCPDGTAVFKLHGQTCAQAGKSGVAQNDGCTAAGGSVGSDDTCRCVDGTAVFKLHGQTCDQFLAASGATDVPPVDSSLDSGAALALTGGAAKPMAHYGKAPPAVPGVAKGIGIGIGMGMGLADGTTQPTLAQQLVQAQQVLQDCLASAADSGGGQGPGAGGGEELGTGAACVFCEKATGTVQSTCVPNTDLAGCYNAFNTYYEATAPGSYEARLLPGATCAQARALATKGPLKGACVFIERATGVLQATCTADATPAGCDSAFQTYYEGPAPGRFEHLLVNGQSCADAQAKYAAKAPDTGTATPPGTTPPPVTCWCGWSTNALCGVWKDNQLYYPYFGPIGSPYSCGDGGAYDLCRQPELVALKAAVCQ